MDLVQDIHMVKAQIRQPQAASRHGRVLHREGVVRGTTIGEIEATEGAGEQVDLDAAFQPRRPARWPRRVCWR